MGVFEQFPYTNLHELNIDWILSKMKELEAMAEQHVIDTVARAGVAQNAQDIADLQTEVTNNATTAHNEALAAQNTANTANTAAANAQNTANTANNTANAANAAITTLNGYFERFSFELAAGGSDSYFIGDKLTPGQVGIFVATARGYAINNTSCIMVIYKTNVHVWVTEPAYQANSSYRLSIDADGYLTNTQTQFDVTYDCMLYKIRT